MLILALDTTSEWGGAAIFRDDKCVASAANSGTANYSAALFEEVDDLFQKVSLSFPDLDLIAAANGPGSFTGIRVGLAAAQGWADTFGKPARGVSVLAAMIDAAQPGTPWAVPMLDARRGEFYAGIFHRADALGSHAGPPALDTSGQFTAACEGAVMKPEQLPAFIEAGVGRGQLCTLIARDKDAAACGLRDLAGGTLRWKLVDSLLLSSIARLAGQAEMRGAAPSLHELSAFYVRRSEAELNWKD